MGMCAAGVSTPNLSTPAIWDCVTIHSGWESSLAKPSGTLRAAGPSPSPALKDAFLGSGRFGSTCPLSFFFSPVNSYHLLLAPENHYGLRRETGVQYSEKNKRKKYRLWAVGKHAWTGVSGFRTKQRSTCPYVGQRAEYLTTKNECSSGEGWVWRKAGPQSWPLSLWAVTTERWLSWERAR